MNTAIHAKEKKAIVLPLGHPSATSNSECACLMMVLEKPFLVSYKEHELTIKERRCWLGNIRLPCNERIPGNEERLKQNGNSWQLKKH